MTHVRVHGDRKGQKKMHRREKTRLLTPSYKTPAGSPSHSCLSLTQGGVIGTQSPPGGGRILCKVFFLITFSSLRFDFIGVISSISPGEDLYLAVPAKSHFLSLSGLF